jgi:flagellum-specific peptidoglycan hydrolase FlgJ
VRSVRKPWWQQATALVTVSTGGVLTGFNFVPGAAATMTSPTSVPLHLLALEQAARPGTVGDLAVGGDSAGQATSDAQLRAAIVNVAGYYLRLAQTRTPAQMEALIWDNTSSNGADHGESCAAFASLTLELAAQAVGQQSWVTGGTTYPWPLPEWADVRVDPNPASPQVTSLVADAHGNGRWHPLGDGYQPQPGDWAVYDGHVEVVTSYSGGVLDTIGADSLPNLTVNAHSSSAPLADQGVAGFVDNGTLTRASGTLDAPAPAAGPARAKESAPARSAPQPAKKAGAAGTGAPKSAAAGAAVPGLPGAGALAGTGGIPGTSATAGNTTTLTEAGRAASIPGLPSASAPGGTTDAQGAATIPGASPAASAPVKPPAHPSAPRSTGSAGSAHAHPAAAPAASSAPSAKPGPSSSASAGQPYSTPGTRNQQAFISLVAPGAVAAQQRYGVPAAVTIAQAIEESAWGQSGLAAQYHNLFGIKGTGPAGSASLPTQEYLGGQWVTIDAQFRAYHNDAESIADHAELLATSGYYTRAMADRSVPDAFANDLTGVYATDPNYGANLIALMKLYNLYQYDTAPAVAPVASPAAPTAPASAATPAPGHSASPAAPTAPARAATTAPASSPGAAPQGRPGGQSGHSGAWHAEVPGVAAPALAPAAPGATHASSTAAGTSAASGGQIPGVVSPGALAPAGASPLHVTAPTGTGARKTARYEAPLPQAVTAALFASAKAPLARGEHLYRDVAAGTGGSWKLLAAVDWMQCKADPRYSPVQGEKLGSLNEDGTSYSTKSAALTQCACDLIELASAVYGIDLTARRPLSVRQLAAAFAAFRWGAILLRHGVSPMEFPYSVAGLTAQHQKMHWPAIEAPDAPDRPGGRFREPYGAVPVLLSLGYPATV